MTINNIKTGSEVILVSVKPDTHLEHKSCATVTHSHRQTADGQFVICDHTGQYWEA